MAHGTDASLLETRASIGSHTTAIRTIANPYGGRSEHATPCKWPRRKRIPQRPYLEKAPNQITLNQGRESDTSSRDQRGQARCTPRCRQRRRLSRRTHCSIHSRKKFSWPERPSRHGTRGSTTEFHPRSRYTAVPAVVKIRRSLALALRGGGERVAAAEPRRYIRQLEKPISHLDPFWKSR